MLQKKNTTSAFVPTSAFRPTFQPTMPSIQRLTITPLKAAPLPAVAPATNNRSVYTNTTMKIFDWKRRGQPLPVYDETENPLTQHNITYAPGSKKRGQRKGRGEGQGSAGTCGFGMRGQKSRAGRPTRPGFEGGQMPLYRRLPKFVGRPMGPGHTHTEYYPLKIDALNACEDGAQVSQASLLEAGVITKQSRKLLFKVVGGKDPLTKKNLTVRAHGFTESAAKQIEDNGGKCVLISPTTGADLFAADDAPQQE